MAIKDIVRENRSRRRFYQDHTIERQTLVELVDLARLSPSGANKQPLKYMLSHQAETNAQIFATLAWAAYLEDWPGPVEGEQPSAYIVILGDTSIKDSFDIDVGIAVQTIMLAATELGLGGCIIASIRRKELRKILDIPEKFEIPLILALGKPKEQVVVDPVGADGDIRYWRDEQAVHHVPKRSLDEIIIN